MLLVTSGEVNDIAFTLLKTSQGKFTTECINFLMEHGQADELAAALNRWKSEQNLRAPVLLWIIKNRHSKKFAKLLNDHKLASELTMGLERESAELAHLAEHQHEASAAPPGEVFAPLDCDASQLAAVLDLDVVAVAAERLGLADEPIGGGKDRRAGRLRGPEDGGPGHARRRVGEQ